MVSWIKHTDGLHVPLYMMIGLTGLLVVWPIISWLIPYVANCRGCANVFAMPIILMARMTASVAAYVIGAPRFLRHGSAAILRVAIWRAVGPPPTGDHACVAARSVTISGAPVAV